MIQVVSILFGAGFTIAVCLAAGLLALDWGRAPVNRQERLPVAFVLGAALLNLLVFALGMIHAYHWWAFLAAGAAVVGLAWRRGCFRLPAERFPVLGRFDRMLSTAICAAFGALYFFYALAPEMSPDGSSYHLGLVSRYLRAGGLERITTNMYANLSQGIEMLYVFAFAFGRHSSAALVHLAFLAALAAMIVNYGRRFGLPRAGLFGALICFLSPVVGMDASTAYNDVAAAAVLFTVFYLLRIWWDHPTDRLLALVGLLAGFCYAVKYTAALAVPAVGVVVLVKYLREGRLPVRRLAILGFCALLMIAPWMVRDLVWLDNPVSPLFNKLFPNPYTHISFEEAYRHQMRNYPNLASHWDIPAEVTLRGNVLCGLLGPLFLLAPIGLIALRWREGRWLWVAALVAGLPYASNVGTRFLIPPLPYVSLAMAMVFLRVPRLTPAIVVAHAILSWPSMIGTYSDPSAWRIDGVRWRAALRLEPEDSFLTRMFPGYSVARMVEEKVPPGGRILTFSQIPIAYTTRETLVVYQGAFNEVLGDMLWTPFNPAAHPIRRIRFEFDARPLSGIRVVQTAGGAPEQWSISEFRLYHAGEELPREADWLLHAEPNPWDVQRAFDNSPVTRWRSWEGIHCGMHVGIEFPASTVVDAAEIQCTADQWSIKLRLEGRDPGGEWHTITDDFTERNTRAPAGMRRMVANELKRAGVDYILVHPNDLGKEDFRERPRAWGVTLLGERNGIRLYRLD